MPSFYQYFIYLYLLGIYFYNVIRIFKGTKLDEEGLKRFVAVLAITGYLYYLGNLGISLVNEFSIATNTEYIFIFLSIISLSLSHKLFQEKVIRNWFQKENLVAQSFINIVVYPLLTFLVLIGTLWISMLLKLYLKLN